MELDLWEELDSGASASGSKAAGREAHRLYLQRVTSQMRRGYTLGGTHP